MRKGGTPDSRCWQFSSILTYFRRFSRFRLTKLLMSVLGKLGISRKLVMSTFPLHKSCVILSSEYETTGFGIRAAGEVSLLAVRFPVLILGSSGMLLMSQENLLLGKLFIFEKLPTFWKLIKWIEKTVRTKATSKWVSLCPKYLSEISLSVGPFSAVLAITPSF
jgi:hypothetical protein